MKRMIVALAAVLALSAFAGAASAEDAAPALKGYCPVAYAAMGKAVKGDPAISIDTHGKHYVFANAEAKRMFAADPSKYNVAYDGLCATALAMGKKIDGDPTQFTVVNGTTYLFSSAEAKKMFTGNASGTIEKANTQWASVRPQLDGYCPVAYAAMGKAVKGDPEVALDFHGKHYLFANAEAKKMFEADPAKYNVAYDGLCATAMAMGKEIPGEPTLFSVASGRTYLFSSADAKKMFDAGPVGTIKKSDAQWAKLTAN